MLRFKGGIHPDEHKYTVNTAIEAFPPPHSVTLPLNGDKCAVNRGDWVSVGDSLTERSLSHASISGKITEITYDHITIESDGKMTRATSLRPFAKRLTEATQEEIIDYTAKLGIISSNSYLHDRLIAAKDKTKILLISCGETEPFLCAEHRIMAENKKAILYGAKILMKALSPHLCVFTFEAHHKKDYKEFSDLTVTQKNMEVICHSAKYPADDETLLIKAFARRFVKISSGITKENIFTVKGSVCAELFESFKSGMPSVTKTLTVDGDKVTKPSVLTVPLGCSAEDILTYADAGIDDSSIVLCGGPIKGNSVALDFHINKNTTAILALTRADKNEKVYECISCGLCHKSCPMSLYPQRYLFGDKNATTRCIGCGCCTYICPAKIDFAMVKKEEKHR